MKWTTDNMPSQAGKTAIVTGGNSGIGLEAAKALAAKGAQVVLACRDQGRGEDACARIRRDMPDASVTWMGLDLADLASIGRFAQEFLDTHPRLDILVNNAGVMVPPRSRTADGFEIQMGVNHLGHFALTGLLLERLMLSDDPRLVVVSSSAHKLGRINLADLGWSNRCYCAWRAYGDSKLANLYFLNELNRRYGGGKLKAVAVHPGWTGTSLQRTSCLRRFNCLFAMKPWQGALPTLYAATSGEVQSGQFIGPDGCMEAKGYPTVVEQSYRARDRHMAESLWEESSRLTGVRFPAAH